MVSRMPRFSLPPCFMLNGMPSPTMRASMREAVSMKPMNISVLHHSGVRSRICPANLTYRMLRQERIMSPTVFERTFPVMSRI